METTIFEPGDTIDSKYKIDGLCSNNGGMGTILFVSSLKKKKTKLPKRIVLKYSNNSDKNSLKRFKREVRLLNSFVGNSKVIQILDKNLDYDPPYFVMKYYEEGDLSSIPTKIQDNHEDQEKFFLKMIDCVQELHSRDEFHRDIKPQNFLLEGSTIVVSDFGLAKEIGSDSGFTKTSMAYGSHGYFPPEFISGGFKYADATGDIFMLGKTIYVLASNRDPLYLVEDGIPNPIFHVIEKCCNSDKDKRYQTLPELRQSIVAAFDVILQRGGGLGKVKQLLSSIEDRLTEVSKYSSSDVSSFVEQLAIIEKSDQIKVCFELSTNFFKVIRQEPLSDALTEFLNIYGNLVESKDYSWSYAEKIAKHMKLIFNGKSVALKEKKRALDLGIRAAAYMNRFAAMDTCISIITSIKDDSLGMHIASLILEDDHAFISGIEISECKCESIITALKKVQNEQS